MRPVNRVQPVGPPEAYTSWRIRQPIATHFRAATCQEVGCLHHARGWTTTVDEATELGRDQAGYIRTQSGRRYTETRGDVDGVDTGLTVFTFPPGQPCFRSGEHREPLERDPLFYRQPGDWRARAPGRQYDRADQWVADFAEHTDNLKHKLEG